MNAEFIQLLNYCANILEMKTAKRNKIRDIIENGTCKVVFQENIHPDGNLLLISLKSAMKSNTDRNINYREHDFIRRPKNELKEFITYSSATLYTQVFACRFKKLKLLVAKFLW